MSGMLKGLKVIDLTNNIAGPGCAAMLADHGAEVIHIEKPVWGDDSRNYSPQVNGTSVSYYFLNRGKKSVVMDLKDQKFVEVIKNIVKTADVLVESSRPGVMQRLGLDYETMHAINPKLVYCSVSAFGQTGPFSSLAGYDIIAQSYSGMLYYTGDADSKPVKNYFSIGDFVGAYNAYGSIMTALYHRANTGIGQHVDVSLARSLLTMNMCISDKVSGVPRQKTGSHDSHLCPYGIFSGPNGESLVIGVINIALWEKLCNAMNRPEFINDPLYMTNNARCEHPEDIIKIIEDWLAGFDSAAQAAEILTSYGVPNIKVYTVDDILNDEHAKKQGWIKEFPLDPENPEGKKTCPGVHGYADFSKASISLSRAPRLGEHSMEILTQYGMNADEVCEYEAKWNR